MLQVPADLHVTFVEGDDSPLDVVFEAIESRHGDYWIAGLELDPPEMLQVLSLNVDELPEPDPNLARRRYRFSVAKPSLAVGPHAASLRLQTRHDPPATIAPLPLIVSVVDPVAVVPNPLVIRSVPGSEPQPRRVHVVYRAGEGTASVLEYDPSMLCVTRIQEQSHRAQAFEVLPVKTSCGGFETRVLFAVADGQIRELLVRFVPSE